MKILIAGGSGFIGSYLTKRFLQDGHQVNIVSRNAGDISWHEDDLIKALETTDVLINLAGRSINCRHTSANKAAIVESRLWAVSKLGCALAKCTRLPHIWINASATAIYEGSNTHTNTELDFVPGVGFLADTVNLWEYTFFSFALPEYRQVALRTSVVLGRNGGAFKPLSMLTKLGLGGAVGSGEQLFSWLHIEDYYQVVLHCVHTDSINGSINLSSPKPLPQAHLMSVFRRAMHVPLGLPAPDFVVKLGAFFIRTEASLLLDPVNVFPKILLDNGFEFKYPDAQSAIQNLLNK